MALPFYGMVITAFSPAPNIITFPLRWVPSQLTLEHFRATLAQARWLVYYGNSLLVALVVELPWHGG